MANSTLNPAGQSKELGVFKKILKWMSKAKSEKTNQQKPELQELAHEVYNMFLEAYSKRQLIEPMWDWNAKYYSGRLNSTLPTSDVDADIASSDIITTTGVGDLKVYTANRVAGVCIAKAAALTATTPTIKITPRSTGETETQYVIKPQTGRKITQKIRQADKAMQQVPSEVSEVLSVLQQNSIDALTGNVAITPEQHDDLMVIQDSMGAPLFSEDDFWCVDDILESDFLQTTWDALWEVSSGDEMFKTAALDTVIFGFGPFLVQWDFDEKRFQFYVVNNKNCFVDPLVADHTQSHYLGFDQVMSADECAARYPKHKQAIFDNAVEGTILANMMGPFRLGDVYQLQTLWRPMVILRTCWTRYQSFPCSLEEALESKKVSTTNGTEFVLLDDDGNEGVTTSTTSANWPTKSGVRETKLINDYVLETGKSDYEDIPMMFAVNIPEPFSPYGIGEPERLRPLQDAINSCVTSIANNLAYGQSGCYAVPMEVKEAWPANVSMYQHPGMSIGIKGDVWTKYQGHLFEVIPPPSIPPQAGEMLVELNNVLDKVSMQSEVLQGAPTSEATSGVAIEALQSAGAATMGFTAKSMEHMLHSIVRVGLGSMLKWMTIADWQAYNKKYPLGVATAVVGRAKHHDHDIMVEIAAGKGSIKRQFKQLLIQLSQGGKISTLDLLEGLEIPDAKGVATRAAQSQITDAKLAGQAQAEGRMQAQQQQPQMPMAAGNPVEEQLQSGMQGLPAGGNS